MRDLTSSPLLRWTHVEPMMLLFSSSVAWSSVISSNILWLTIDALSFIIPCLSFSWSNPCGSLMMGSINRCSTFASVWSSHVAVVTCCPFFSCTVIALMRPFVLGGSADACGLSFVCCSVFVFCRFDVLPSVMLSSNVLLDIGLPASALAGAIDGANCKWCWYCRWVCWCLPCDCHLRLLWWWWWWWWWWWCLFVHRLLILNSWCLLLLCCDAFLLCLLWCWCCAWQDEMWIVVWWTRCPWCTIDDVHQLSIVFPWFDLSPDGSCFDDLASNPNIGFSWGCVLSKPDAWIESVLKFGVLLDGWWWHVENASPNSPQMGVLLSDFNLLK